MPERSRTTTGKSRAITRGPSGIRRCRRSSRSSPAAANASARLERQHEGCARTLEIKLLVAQRESENRALLKRRNLAYVPADADAIAEQDHHAGTHVPTEAVVVGLEQARHGELDVGLEQAETRKHVRPHRTDLRDDHEVAHDSQDVRCLARHLAKEVPGVADVGLEAHRAPQPAERDADVAVLVFALTGRLTA